MTKLFSLKRMLAIGVIGGAILFGSTATFAQGRWDRDDRRDDRREDRFERQRDRRFFENRFRERREHERWERNHRFYYPYYPY